MNMDCKVLFALTLLASLGCRSAGKLITKPRPTDIKINHTTYFKCSTNIAFSDIFWFHGKNYIYTGHVVLEPYHERFAIDISERNGTYFYNLVIRSVQPSDAGEYICIDDEGFGEQYSAQLVVLVSAPRCGSTNSSQGIVEGSYAQVWCDVDYIGNLDPVMEWSKNDETIIDVNASYVNNSDSLTTLRATASERMTSSDHNVTYICKTYFRTPEKSSVFAAMNAPDYRDECKLRISVLYGSRNMFITPRKTTYRKGDRLHCSASGNPPPMYSWKNVDTGYTVDGQSLMVDDAMVLRSTCTYRCSAVNIIAGENKTVSETITFDVAATTWDSPSGRLHTAIVGTGTAVGGIVVTVVGVILLKLAKRKCNAQNKKNESTERRGTPHDYESVSSGDMDSMQQTLDIKMDQSSIMGNQTLNQSMTDTEEYLAATETQGPYDTLGGTAPFQGQRTYITLEAPTPDEEIYHANETSGKPDNYYNVDINVTVNSVFHEQVMHSI